MQGDTESPHPGWSTIRRCGDIGFDGDRAGHRDLLSNPLDFDDPDRGVPANSVDVGLASLVNRAVLVLGLNRVGHVLAALGAGRRLGLDLVSRKFHVTQYDRWGGRCQVL